jgi:hypothetical protein
MNSTILAERQAKAIQAIAEHTRRLGGTYVQPSQRVDSPATKYTLMLEAIAQALASITIDVPSPEPSPAAEPEAAPPPAKPKTATKRSDK